MQKTLDRPLIECPICLQKMKRITVTHLKKHDMTMEEFRAKYGNVIATENNQMFDLSDPKAMSRLTSQVINHIVNDDQVDDTAKAAIQNILQDQDGRFRVALNLAAIHRIGNLDVLFSNLLSVQRVLFSESRLASMTDTALAKAYHLLERSIDSNLEYVKSLSTDRDKKTGKLFEQTNIVNVFANDPNAPDTPKSPAGREKIRALFSSLVKRMEDGSLAKLIEEIPAEVIEESPVVVEPISVVTIRESGDEDKTESPESPEAPDQGGAEGASEEGRDVSG